jgi:hypothetical protein
MPLPIPIRVRMATNVRSVTPVSVSASAVHRKQSRHSSGQQAASFFSSCASARYRHPGQATRGARSQRDRRGEKYQCWSEEVEESEVSALSWETGAGGRDGRGRRVPQRLPPRNVNALLEAKLGIASSRQRWVPRKGRSQSASRGPGIKNRSPGSSVGI